MQYPIALISGIQSVANLAKWTKEITLSTGEKYTVDGNRRREAARKGIYSIEASPFEQFNDDDLKYICGIVYNKKAKVYNNQTSKYVSVTVTNLLRGNETFYFYPNVSDPKASIRYLFWLLQLPIKGLDTYLDYIDSLKGSQYGLFQNLVYILEKWQAIDNLGLLVAENKYLESNPNLVGVQVIPDEPTGTGLTSPGTLPNGAGTGTEPTGDIRLPTPTTEAKKSSTGLYLMLAILGAAALKKLKK